MMIYLRCVILGISVKYERIGDAIQLCPDFTRRAGSMEIFNNVGTLRA